MRATAAIGLFLLALSACGSAPARTPAEMPCETGERLCREPCDRTNATPAARLQCVRVCAVENMCSGMGPMGVGKM